MPLSTIIVLTAVVSVFTFYGSLLFWASRQTEQVLRLKRAGLTPAE